MDKLAEVIDTLAQMEAKLEQIQKEYHIFPYFHLAS